MKLICINLFLLVFNLFTTAQVKPDKTFDHEKFGKKVYGNFSAGMDQGIFLPDDKALEYISTKTGRTINDLKAERELNKQYLSDDKVALQKENAGGKMVLKVEVVKVDNPQLIMGNIIIHAGDKKIVLGNCIQTDMTWVLGNYMILDGSSIPVRAKQITKDELIIGYLESKQKDYSEVRNNTYSVLNVIKVDSENPNGTLKRGAQIEKSDFYHCDFALKPDSKSAGDFKKGTKIINNWNNTYELNETQHKLKFLNGTTVVNEFDIYSASKEQLVLLAELEGAKYYFIAKKDKEEVKAVKPETAAITEPSKEKYSNNTAPSGTSGNNYINEKMFDKPIRGYYMDLTGKIVDAVIKYQSPEMMNNPKSALLIYKIAYNEPGFTVDESTNLITTKFKQEVLAFSVNGHVYVPVDGDKWCILLKEGAIRQSVFIFKSQTGSGKTGFGESQFIHKHSGKSMAVATMGLGFKGNMAKMVEDNKELTTKIENKEEGYKFLQYTKIIDEYNAWFDKQYPNLLKYIYK
jgi:hypothetical protein